MRAVWLLPKIMVFECTLLWTVLLYMLNQMIYQTWLQDTAESFIFTDGGDTVDEWCLSHSHSNTVLISQPRVHVLQPTRSRSAQNKFSVRSFPDPPACEGQATPWLYVVKVSVFHDCTTVKVSVLHFLHGLIIYCSL